MNLKRPDSGCYDPSGRDAAQAVLMPLGISQNALAMESRFGNRWKLTQAKAIPELVCHFMSLEKVATP